MKKVRRKKVFKTTGKTCAALKSYLFITSRFNYIWPEQILCIKFEIIFNYETSGFLKNPSSLPYWSSVLV